VLPPTKSVLVFSQKIVYYDVGSGPTVVLLHGLASQAMFDWGRVIMPLSQRHRVIALDQIGFGESDKPTIDYSSEICEQGRNDFHKYSHQFSYNAWTYVVSVTNTDRIVSPSTVV
jgi:pimeloyl-ACP methyl ester carboxylesterase